MPGTLYLRMLNNSLRTSFFVCLLVIHSYCNSQDSTAKTVPVYFRVTRIIDGDTFYIYNTATGEERIRLIGIDAPESRSSRNKQIGYFGKQASIYLHRLLKAESVRLEYDVSRKDRYGRTLAYAYLPNGDFINAILLKQGYASTLTIPPNTKHYALFSRLQQEARMNGRGLWKKK